MTRVSNPPPKPLIIWDGDCHFCRRWIERWRQITGDKVDYLTSQQIGNRFPEIPREQFERSVVFVEPDGSVSTGAQAVFRSLRCRSSRKWMSWCYEYVPGFAGFSEVGYRVISSNRHFFSAGTQLLWGNDVGPPTYFVARRWFLSLLGLIFLVAFVSLWTQVDGLIGSNGITPVSEFLPAVRTQLGDRAFWIMPTLLWLNSSDAFVHVLCGAGLALSVLLIFRIAPALSLIGLVVSYLSFAAISDGFLNPYFGYQWDILLIETGFFSVFFAPWKLWPTRENEGPPSPAAIFMLKLLLFKLMFMSGVVKLTCGEDAWWNLTALDYHYWSQPLPTVLGWWADQSPEWFKKFSVAFCLVVEIIVPFFIWAPRRLRLIACALLILLQLLIGATGNYNFFNLLTIALCLLLIDDAIWRRWRVGLQTDGDTRSIVSHYFPDRVAKYATIVVLVVSLPFNAWFIYNSFKAFSRPPKFVQSIEPLRIINGYGLFRVMTKDRKEVVIEGSEDGFDWKPYEFKWKPGDVMRPPGWCQPHQPRLDWQMWFAALGSVQQNPWFVQTAIELLRGKPQVAALLAKNPFPQTPPRFIRATFYRYRFANAKEHHQTGAWWKREELGEYLPTVSLDDIR